MLKLGKTAIPRALEALALLDRAKIPLALCTNGGGVPDAVRAKSLTRLLGVEITPSILCQSSTPFRRFVPQFGDRPILALGGRDDSARRVCEALGFKRVFVPQDLLRWRPAIYPWAVASPEHSVEHDFTDLGFAAAFVVHDPLDIGRDMQILYDIVSSRDGVVGRPKDVEDDSQWTADAQVPVFFSNPDLLWSNEFPQPRFGQGSFQTAFKSVFRETTGRDLH